MRMEVEVSTDAKIQPLRRAGDSTGSVFLGEEEVVSSSASDPSCTVTLFRKPGCNGDDSSHVGKLETGQEFTLSDDNWRSARVSGDCKKVEFVDQDYGYPGAPDNAVQRGEVDCFDFPYDLQDDMSGLKVWSLPAGACEDFECKAKHMLKDPKKKCAKAICDHEECCGALARCTTFTCPKSYEHTASKMCTGLKCTKSECCTATTTTTKTTTTTTTTTATTTTTSATIRKPQKSNMPLIVIGGLAGVVVLVWGFFTCQDMLNNSDSQAETRGARSGGRRR